MSSPELLYKNSIRRSFAVTIDGLIIISITYALQGSFAQGRSSLMLMPMVTFLISVCFTVYCEYKYSATIGKLLFGLKILTDDLQEITLKHVLLRNSVQIALSFLSSIGLAIAYSQMDLELVRFINAPIFKQIGDLKKLEASGVQLEALNPFHLVGNLLVIYVYSEFVVMFFNKKRKAIHDYIGKTVVVRSKYL